MARPEPVFYYGVAVAALAAVNESADAADLLPGQVFPWVRLALSVAVAIGGAVFVRSKVTPLVDPQDSDGNKLAPTEINRDGF